jgi:anti-anti-sigma factor
MLTITVEHDEARVPVALMKLAGELDAATYLDVIDSARQLVDQGTRYMVLDLADLTYMGSSGLFVIHSMSMMLRGHEAPNPEDGWSAIHQAEETDQVDCLKLLAPQPQVDRVLERTGMKRFFETYTDRDSAIGSF